MIFSGDNKISFFLFLLASVNGLIFYAGLYYYNLSIAIVDICKVCPLYYITNIVVYIMNFVFLGENIFLTDIIGSMIIMSYNVYNIYVSVNKK